jgi:hypothetical protein
MVDGTLRLNASPPDEVLARLSTEIGDARKRWSSAVIRVPFEIRMMVEVALVKWATSIDTAAHLRRELSAVPPGQITDDDEVRGRMVALQDVTRVVVEIAKDNADLLAVTYLRTPRWHVLRRRKMRREADRRVRAFLDEVAALERDKQAAPAGNADAPAPS